MSINVDDSGDKGPVTTLEGRLRDQAALSGVLNSLYELHLAVLSVETLEENQDAVKHGRTDGGK